MPRMPEHDKEPCCFPVAPTSASTDIKLKLLESKLVPKDIINNFDDAELTDTTYIFVDNNGVPGKLQAINIAPQNISWEQLSSDVKNKILIGVSKQDKLIPGDFIVITENNTIKVVMEAHDIGAITEEEAEVLISEKVALEVATISEQLKEEILAYVNVQLEEFKEDVDEQIYLNKQEIIALTSARIDARLADVDEIVESKIDTKLISACIDSGLIV